MPSLKCCYCGHIWKARVRQPRACPQCKRRFKEGFLPEIIDTETGPEWIRKPISITMRPTEDIILCNLCTDRGQSHEGVFIWSIDDQRYCMTHIVENIIHQSMEYRDADPLGDKVAMREEIKAILVEALARCEVILRK